MAQVAFAKVEGEDKAIAERILFLAIIREEGKREEKTGRTADMKCECGYFHGYGMGCSLCHRWRRAARGGRQWVSTGFYYDSTTSSW